MPRLWVPVGLRASQAPPAILGWGQRQGGRSGGSSTQQWVRSWEPPSQQSYIAASLTADAQLLTVGPVAAQEQQEHKEATDFHGMSSSSREGRGISTGNYRNTRTN